MTIDRRKAALFGAASALRLVLFVGFPSLPDLLTGRVEISTPVTSFKRCRHNAAGYQQVANWLAVQEGLFLYTHNVSPYDGGVFYQVCMFRCPSLPGPG
jgi:phosphatidylinositol glycan class U